MRTLQLLEQHHRKLSELLKFPAEHGSQQSSGEQEAAEGGEKETTPTDSSSSPEESAKSDLASGGPPASAPKPLPTLSHPPRHPARELSSSIASNLATARGIRSRYRGHPLIPSVSSDQAPGSLEVHPRADSPTKSKSRNKTQSRLDQSGKPSWVPPIPAAAQNVGAQAAANVSKAEVAEAGQSDEGFSRFYSTFGSIINRLSAPLAFAGLPLIAEEPAPKPDPPPAPEQPAARRHRSRTSHTTGTEPDLTKIYSKAALRALKGEGHSTNDSFYVVPTSGHTVSYANILSFDHKEKRRMAASSYRDDAQDFDDVDEDDFVDAAESPAPISPGLRKRVGKNQSGKEMQNAVEELYLENTSLKEMLDKLSKRLHAFELNSQSSHLALAQSLRLQRPGSPMSSSGGGGGGGGSGSGNGSGSGSKPDAAEDALRKRNRELEEQLAATMKRMDELEWEYTKVQQTVDKYRDRWEKLKAGAKARSRAQGAVDNGETSKPSR